jgi:Fe/S biogenesis protein NfuA
MIDISESAQGYFRRLLQSQGGDAIGIRVSAVHPGTPKADARLEFCESGDLLGDEWSLECEGFTLYVDAPSVRFLDGAQMDYVTQATGGQLTIRAPKIKGETPGADSSVVERVQYLLDSEINPMLAAHKGQVSLEEVTADGVVRLRFGGGCHGCGMVDVTLKQGIEKTMRERIPEITAIRDATDHATGTAPYIAR